MFPLSVIWKSIFAGFVVGPLMLGSVDVSLAKNRKIYFFPLMILPSCTIENIGPALSPPSTSKKYSLFGSSPLYAWQPLIPVFVSLTTPACSVIPPDFGAKYSVY